MTPTSHARSGFSLIEIILVVALLGIIALRAMIVLTSASSSTAEQASVMVLEEKAQKVLDRIAKAVMEANRETLVPATQAPFDTDDLGYQVHLGVQDGEIVWGDPEMIGLEEELSRVFWSQNPGEQEERKVIWTNMVRPFLEGEIQNGVDDNDNGLVDERGLSFTIDRNAVTIRLSLDRVAEDGRRLTHTVETVVTCRNLPEETP